jgi:uncharacterized damage-inducible protein DinB
MSDLDTIREWMLYNATVREGYLTTLARLPPEELNRDRGASFPSLLDIMVHSLDAIQRWTVRSSAVVGPPYLGVERNPQPTFADVQRYNTEVNAQLGRLLDALREEDLDKTYVVPKRLPVLPEDLTLSVRETLWHLVEEELQHRGELNALLWQIDVEPPIFDWIDWVKLRRSPQ